MQNADVAIVGGGIVGLAFAYAHASRGRKVVLFERTDFAVGATVRNFGLIWPVGQRRGVAHDRAMRSREIWRKIINEAGLWRNEAGSLHLAYHEDELAVLKEFHRSDDPRYGRLLLDAHGVLAKSSAVREVGLLGGLWSPTEINVDPREAARKIRALLHDRYAVALRFGVNVLGISMPQVHTTAGDWKVSEVVVCSGADFESLYPEVFQGSGLTRCKLQMMRTGPQPNHWELGPSLCGGLTLTHYDSFKDCVALRALQARFNQTMPFCVEHGIHVLLSQTALGELTIGDSHHYGSTLEPFDREDVNNAILEYLKSFAKAPSFAISERWNGIYSKLSGRTEFMATPAKSVRVVTGLGGAGMTLSFGLADEVVGDGELVGAGESITRAANTF